MEEGRKHRLATRKKKLLRGKVYREKALQRRKSTEHFSGREEKKLRGRGRLPSFHRRVKRWRRALKQGIPISGLGGNSKYKLLSCLEREEKGKVERKSFSIEPALDIKIDERKGRVWNKRRRTRLRKPGKPFLTTVEGITVNPGIAKTSGRVT